jgi:phosphatidylglycerol:prolipoprotein diacylglycerol transferase
MVRNPLLFNNPVNFFKIWEGGIVFYGGVLTGIPVFLLFTKRYGLPPWKVLDIIAPGIALGIGIGRIGCLLNGCCWGSPTSLPWGVRFPAQSIPWHDHVAHQLIAPDAAYSLAVHPTQVYLAMSGWVLLILLLAYLPHRRRYGEGMVLLMIGYALSRFVIEYLRADEPPLWVDGLTISQNISIVLLVGGVFMWAWLRRAPGGTVLPAAAHSG